MTTNDNIIHSYSRMQAIKDGVLVDVRPVAIECGYSVPVALTAAAWERCVKLPDDIIDQEAEWRLWDVLSMLKFRIRLANSGVRELRFVILLRDETCVEMVELKAVCGPDDDGKPCLAIMLPDED